MRRLIETSAAHALTILAILVGITVYTGLQLDGLSIKVSPEGLMVSDSPERQDYEAIREQFGSDNVTIVVLKDKQLATSQHLQAAHQLNQDISQLPFVDRVESLFSAQYIRTVDDNVLINPYLQNIPEDSKAIQTLFDTALQNPFVSGSLLSTDKQTLALNIYLADEIDIKGSDELITSEIEALLGKYHAQFDEAYQIGLPYVRHTLEKQIFDDQLRLMPQSFLVLLVCLIIILRNLNGGLIPMITSLMSIVWLLGLMAQLDIPVTLVTAIVPILLIIIGSTEDVHLISEYLYSKHSGHNRDVAVANMAKKKGFASLMTFITTWFGFVAVAINPLEILREFAIVASSAMLMNYLITMTFVPAWIMVFGTWKSKPGKLHEEDQRFDRLLNTICYIVHERKKITLILLVALSLVGIYGASQIRLNNNVMAYFDDDSEIKQRSEAVANDLSGIESFSVVIGSGIHGTFLHERYLNELHRLKTFISEHPQFDTATAFSDYMGLLNSAVNETGDIEVPDENYIINELSLFVDPDDVSQFVSSDHSTALIHVRHNLGSTYEFNQALAELRAFIDENMDRALNIRITGESVLVNQAADEMAAGQAKSLALILLIIFIMTSMIFWNPKAGLMAILPNLFPIIVLFGVMGFMQIPLDTGTAMIAVIAIGIIVDNTMHFMSRYNAELKQSYDEEAAIAATIRAEALPILSTSIALIFGFLVLLQSSFVPIVYFGALSALVIFVALISDFLLTPILLSNIRLITLWDILSLDLKEKLIKQCRLFKGMKPWQVKKLILLSRINTYNTGATIMKQGDVANEMYILLEGAVEITMTDGKEERTVMESPESGRLFGMMRFDETDHRATTAIAKQDSQILVISWQGIERIARFYPKISSLFFKNLSNLLGGRLLDHLKSGHTNIQEIRDV